MIIKKFVLGPILTNAYLLIQNKSAVLIDCQEPEVILNYLEKNNLKLRAILITHGHFDHTEGSMVLREKTNAPIYMNKEDLTVFYGTDIKIDKFFKNNELINFNGLKIKVIFTPGHTRGSVSFYIKEKDILFSGDTLFNKGIGRFDFSGSSYDSLISSLKNRLFKLPEKTKVLPGHGSETTISKSKSYLKNSLHI